MMEHSAFTVSRSYMLFLWFFTLSCSFCEQCGGSYHLPFAVPEFLLSLTIAFWTKPRSSTCPTSCYISLLSTGMARLYGSTPPTPDAWVPNPAYFYLKDIKWTFLISSCSPPTHSNCEIHLILSWSDPAAYAPVTPLVKFIWPYPDLYL